MEHKSIIQNCMTDFRRKILRCVSAMKAIGAGIL